MNVFYRKNFLIFVLAILFGLNVAGKDIVYKSGATLLPYSYTVDDADFAEMVNYTDTDVEVIGDMQLNGDIVELWLWYLGDSNFTYEISVDIYDDSGSFIGSLSMPIFAEKEFAEFKYNGNFVGDILPVAADFHSGTASIPIIAELVGKDSELGLASGTKITIRFRPSSDPAGMAGSYSNIFNMSFTTEVPEKATDSGDVWVEDVDMSKFPIIDLYFATQNIGGISEVLGGETGLNNNIDEIGSFQNAQTFVELTEVGDGVGYPVNVVIVYEGDSAMDSAAKKSFEKSFESLALSGLNIAIYEDEYGEYIKFKEGKTTKDGTWFDPDFVGDDGYPGTYITTYEKNTYPPVADGILYNGMKSALEKAIDVLNNPANFPRDPALPEELVPKKWIILGTKSYNFANESGSRSDNDTSGIEEVISKLDHDANEIYLTFTYQQEAKSPADEGGVRYDFMAELNSETVADDLYEEGFIGLGNAGSYAEESAINFEFFGMPAIKYWRVRYQTFFDEPDGTKRIEKFSIRDLNGDVFGPEEGFYYAPKEGGYEQTIIVDLNIEAENDIEDGGYDFSDASTSIDVTGMKYEGLTGAETIASNDVEYFRFFDLRNPEDGDIALPFNPDITPPDPTSYEDRAHSRYLFYDLGEGSYNKWKFNGIDYSDDPPRIDTKGYLYVNKPDRNADDLDVISWDMANGVEIDRLSVKFPGNSTESPLQDTSSTEPTELKMSWDDVDVDTSFTDRKFLIRIAYEGESVNYLYNVYEGENVYVPMTTITEESFRDKSIDYVDVMIDYPSSGSSRFTEGYMSFELEKDIVNDKLNLTISGFPIQEEAVAYQIYVYSIGDVTGSPVHYRGITYEFTQSFTVNESLDIVVTDPDEMGTDLSFTVVEKDGVKYIRLEGYLTDENVPPTNLKVAIVESGTTGMIGTAGFGFGGVKQFDFPNNGVKEKYEFVFDPNDATYPTDVSNMIKVSDLVNGIGLADFDENTLFDLHVLAENIDGYTESDIVKDIKLDLFGPVITGVSVQNVTLETFFGNIQNEGYSAFASPSGFTELLYPNSYIEDLYNTENILNETETLLTFNPPVPVYLTPSYTADDIVYFKKGDRLDLTITIDTADTSLVDLAGIDEFTLDFTGTGFTGDVDGTSPVIEEKFNYTGDILSTGEIKTTVYAGTGGDGTKTIGIEFIDKHLNKSIVRSIDLGIQDDTPPDNSSVSINTDAPDVSNMKRVPKGTEDINITNGTYNAAASDYVIDVSASEATVEFDENGLTGIVGMLIIYKYDFSKSDLEAEQAGAPHMSDKVGTYYIAGINKEHPDFDILGNDYSGKIYKTVSDEMSDGFYDLYLVTPIDRAGNLIGGEAITVIGGEFSTISGEFAEFDYGEDDTWYVDTFEPKIKLINSNPDTDTDNTFYSSVSVAKTDLILKAKDKNEAFGIMVDPLYQKIVKQGDEVQIKYVVKDYNVSSGEAEYKNTIPSLNPSTYPKYSGIDTIDDSTITVVSVSGQDTIKEVYVGDAGNGSVDANGNPTIIVTGDTEGSTTANVLAMDLAGNISTANDEIEIDMDVPADAEIYLHAYEIIESLGVSYIQGSKDAVIPHSDVSAYNVKGVMNFTDAGWNSNYVNANGNKGYFTDADLVAGYRGEVYVEIIRKENAANQDSGAGDLNEPFGIIAGYSGGTNKVTSDSTTLTSHAVTGMNTATFSSIDLTAEKATANAKNTMGIQVFFRKNGAVQPNVSTADIYVDTEVNSTAAIVSSGGELGRDVGDNKYEIDLDLNFTDSAGLYAYIVTGVENRAGDSYSVSFTAGAKNASTTVKNVGDYVYLNTDPYNFSFSPSEGGTSLGTVTFTLDLPNGSNGEPHPLLGERAVIKVKLIDYLGNYAGEFLGEYILSRKGIDIRSQSGQKEIRTKVKAVGQDQFEVEGREEGGISDQ